jgi:NAD(P)H dehydrogenase (quinone)
MNTIAVTGATGKLGGRRSPPRAGRRAPATAGPRPRVQTLFMVSAVETPQRVQQHRTFIDAAAAAGVEHAVYTSFFGASPTATFTLARDHWDTEQHLAASGMAYTFLRDNVYADLFPYLAGADGVLRGPAGQGRVAAVAQDDMAEVAALVLQLPARHAGWSYDLTGPEALTLAEVAATLAWVTRRTVTYEPETLEQAYASRRAFSDSQWQLDAWVSTYTAIAVGDLDGVSEAVPAVTGHPATALPDLLRRADAA